MLTTLICSCIWNKLECSWLTVTRQQSNQAQRQHSDPIYIGTRQKLTAIGTIGRIADIKAVTFSSIRLDATFPAEY